ncbi:MAG: hypothetical protein JXA09_12805 [Anaerolineae bacterium]|nr:hypothetical protein [Anaerolineae bacterium]
MTQEPIPHSLAPFLPEYDLGTLDLDRAAWTVIERTLRYGDRRELRWLYHRYPEAQIAEWVRRWGAYALPPPHLAFWRLLLGLDGEVG